MLSKRIHTIRLEPVLSTRCLALASEHQQSFSEWVRTILRREVGLLKGKQ
jgi:predicted HicB family RNase H-like nuclease